MTIAFTVWWNDLVQLDMWLKYYSKHFDHLHVICCATKEEYIPKLEERKLKYNFTYERVSEAMGSAELANVKINETQIEFLKTHEWVLYSNCDEAVCADPRKYKDLRDFMAKTKKNYTPCEAYDVLWEKEEPVLDYSQPLLKQRKYWVRNISYNKILLSKVPLHWNEGQHQIDGQDHEESKTYQDTGLFLVHFKWADSMDNRDLGPFRSNGSREFKEEDKVKIPEYMKEIV